MSTLTGITPLDPSGMIPLSSVRYCGLTKPDNPVEGDMYIDPLTSNGYVYTKKLTGIYDWVIAPSFVTPEQKNQRILRYMNDLVNAKDRDLISLEEFFSTNKMLLSDDDESVMLACSIIDVFNRQ